MCMYIYIYMHSIAIWFHCFIDPINYDMNPMSLITIFNGLTKKGKSTPETSQIFLWNILKYEMFLHCFLWKPINWVLSWQILEILLWKIWRNHHLSWENSLFQWPHKPINWPKVSPPFCGQVSSPLRDGSQGQVDTDPWSTSSKNLGKSMVNLRLIYG